MLFKKLWLLIGSHDRKIMQKLVHLGRERAKTINFSHVIKFLYYSCAHLGPEWPIFFSYRKDSNGEDFIKYRSWWLQMRKFKFIVYYILIIAMFMFDITFCGGHLTSSSYVYYYRCAHGCLCIKLCVAFPQQGRHGPVLGVAILKSCSKIIPTKQYSPRTSLFPLFVVALWISSHAKII